MSKFRTMVTNSVEENQKLNKANEERAIKQIAMTTKHASYEINQNKADQAGLSDHIVNTDLTTATKIMLDTAKIYKKAFDEMTNLSLEVINNSKVLTQKSKDYAGQVGEALARIDKVLVKDFEIKLILLERFVVASKEMAELEKSGALQKISMHFKS